jgi:hypothetical protein
VGGIKPAGCIAQFAQRHAIEAPQACGIIWFALINTEPVVLGLDLNHQGVAKQLGAIFPEPGGCGVAHR